MITNPLHNPPVPGVRAILAVRQPRDHGAFFAGQFVGMKLGAEDLPETSGEFLPGKFAGNRALMKHAGLAAALGTAGNLPAGGNDVASNWILEAFVLALGRGRSHGVQRGVTGKRGGDGFVKRPVSLTGCHFVERVTDRDDDSVGGVGSVINDSAAGRAADESELAGKFDGILLEVAEGDSRLVPTVNAQQRFGAVWRGAQ